MAALFIEKPASHLPSVSVSELLLFLTAQADQSKRNTVYISQGAQQNGCVLAKKLLDVLFNRRTTVNQDPSCLTSSKELSKMAALFIEKPASLLPSASVSVLLLFLTARAGTKSGSTLQITPSCCNSSSTACIGYSSLGKNISTGSVHPEKEDHVT